MILTYITIEFVFILKPTRCTNSGPGNSVGIATEYELDGPESNPGGENFPPFQTGPGAHPASCTMGTESFPGVKSGRGVTLPLTRSSAAVMEE